MKKRGILHYSENGWVVQFSENEYKLKSGEKTIGNYSITHIAKELPLHPSDNPKDSEIHEYNNKSVKFKIVDVFTNPELFTYISASKGGQFAKLISPINNKNVIKHISSDVKTTTKSEDMPFNEWAGKFLEMVLNESVETQSWDEIHTDYMEIPLNERPLFFNYLKKNYKPPMKK